MVGDFKTPLYVLLAAVGCVLLITCLNVASLLLARSVARRREIAVRSALGGSRWRIIQEQLIESLLLALGGGLLAAAVAYSLIRWIVAVRPDLPRTESLHIDAPLLAFAVCLTFLTGLLAGFLPALSSRGGTLAGFLQDSSRSIKTGRSQASLRKYLVGMEVAFTAVLLIGSGLLLKSFFALRFVALGCSTKNILTMDLSLPKDSYQDPAKAASFFDALLRRVRALPGVQAAGAITTLPGAGYSGDTGFTIPEHPPLPKGKFQFAINRGVDPDAFKTLEIPVVRGRVFTPYDWQQKAKRVIISAAFARKSFPHEDPIGKHLRVNGGRGIENYTIIGVVSDTRWRLTQPIKPMVYFPIYDNFGAFSLAVRSNRNPLSLALPIQKIIAQLDANLGVANVLSFDQVIGESVASQSFEAAVVTGFALLSLILASIGLYGVLSYVVTQRTSEIGIRIALGAQRGTLVGSTLYDGIKPALIGLLIGIAAGLAGARLLQSLLFGTAPTDPEVFLIVPLAVLIVAALACALPALRAASVDPLTALRSE